MPVPGPADAPPSERLRTIAEVAAETGIQKDTLRVWERRYGFPQPQRNAHGQRGYDAQQLQRLRLVKRLLDAGHRAGAVVPLEEARLRALLAEAGGQAPPPGPKAQADGSAATPAGSPVALFTVPFAAPFASSQSASPAALLLPQSAPQPQPAPAQTLAARRRAARGGGVGRAAARAAAQQAQWLRKQAQQEVQAQWPQWLAWLRAGDVAAMQQALAHHALRQGLLATIDGVLRELAAKVGQAWFAGALTVAQEHLYTEAVTRFLQDALRSAEPAQAAARPPRVLLTTLPGEQHTLGLLMAECALALEGCERLSLGRDTPLADVVQAARQWRVDVVALSVSQLPSAAEVWGGLAELQAQLGGQAQIWVGGSSSHLGRRGMPPGPLVMASVSELAAQVQRWRATDRELLPDILGDPFREPALGQVGQPTALSLEERKPQQGIPSMQQPNFDP